ncbi:MAG TPA: GNVR domain-containing protein [Burkholderiaceae bacterium]|nr:GNVR domain-containing protein [Burkholderiaceae bacterium]
MTLPTIIGALRTRWVLFLTSFLVPLLIGLAALQAIPNKYSATSTLVFGGMTDPMRSALAPASSTIYLTTQVDILKSERIAAEAVTRLSAGARGPLEEAWRGAQSDQSFMAWATGFVRRGSRVEFSRDSNVVRVSFSSRDAGLSAEMANAIVDSFVSIAVDIRGQAAEQYQTSYERQTQQARNRLQDAQNALLKYQSEHKSLASDAGLEAEVRRLSELSDRVSGLRSTVEQARVRERDASRRRDRPASASADAVWTTLTGQEQVASAELAEAAERYGSEHPRVKELTTRLQTLRTQLRAHRERLTTDLGNERTLAERQLDAGVREEAELKARLLRLGEVRAGAATLERDLRAAQTAYDQLLNVLQQTGSQAQSKVGDASILERAAVSGRPASPNRILSTLGVGLFSLALAAVIVLVRELMDPRVRDEVHLEQLTGLPLPFSVPRFESSPTFLLARNRALLGGPRSRR